MRITQSILLCTLLLLGSSCASSSSSSKQWEYRVVSTTDPDKGKTFNELAKQGWQLVGSDPLKGYLFRRAKPPSP